MKAVNYDTNIGIIVTGTRIIDEEGTVTSEATNKAGGCSTTDFVLSWFKNEVPVYCCNTLYNTRGLKELGGFKSKTNLYEDCAALFQLAGKFGRKDIHDVKASFRRHSHNTGGSAPIKDWCEDSLYLLNIMCDLSGDKKELVRREGMHYFCKVNYIRSRRIKRSRLERYYTYWFVYKTFEYVYSPIHYLCGGNLFSKNFAYRLLSYLKRKMREIWFRAPAQ